MKKYMPILAGITCSTIFGLSYFFTIMAQDALGNDDFKLLAIRFALSAVILNIGRLAGVLKISYKGKPIKKLMLAALFSPLFYYVLEIFALRYSPSSQIGLITSISPVILTILGVLFFKEYPTGRQVFFVCLTVAGVLISNISGFLSGSVNPLGLALTVMILFSGCFATLAIKNALSDFNTLEIICFNTSAGAVVYFLISLGQHVINGNVANYFNGVFTAPFVIGILYLSVMSSIIGFGLNYFAVSKLPLAVVSSFSAIGTVVSIVIGVLLLNEPFSPTSVVGAALIVLSVWLLNASAAGAQKTPKIIEAHDGELPAEIPPFYAEVPVSEDGEHKACEQELNVLETAVEVQGSAEVAEKTEEHESDENN